MNSIFAAGMFDNPWVVVAMVIVGAVANWVSKRREKKQAERQSRGDEPSPSPGKPAGEFNLEETLRRLMGEEPTAQRPPHIPRAEQDELPSAQDWQEEEEFQPVRQMIPPVRPPVIATAPVSIKVILVNDQEEEAARRFEQFNEQARHPATVVDHGRGHRSRAGRGGGSRWRDPRSARQAFVASLVFAPPKGLEP